MPSPIEAALGAGGALSRVLPGYEPRAEQIAMAHAVEEAILRERHLVIEAGTGTGKSLAYLLPAALSGKKVVISTATKTLQEQILNQDLPLLASMGVTTRAVAMKGRQNYLCLLRKEQFESAPEFQSRQDALLWREVQQWARTTEDGDRAELELPENFGVWKDVSSTADTCTGTRCAHYEKCFVFAMRRRAQDADLVIVNHHLFFADLALRSSSAGEYGAQVIPNYDVVIFDEAHALEDAATEHFGVSVSTHRVAELVSDAKRAVAEKESGQEDVDRAGAQILASSKRFFDSVPGGESRGRLTREALAPATSARDELQSGLALFAQTCGRLAAPALEALARRAANVAADLDVVGRADDPSKVYWSERRGRGVFLHAAPIDVARELRERLYKKARSCIFTSATLAAGGSLEFFTRRMGLVSEGEEALPVVARILPSPFDYQTQAAIYAPQSMPEPASPAFAEAVAREVLALCEISRGRAFVLFTSHKNLRLVSERCRPLLPYRVLIQGERPKSALLRDFKAEPSVLFASQSFWEGVDVPGEALSLVIIDKLPFASPGDPLVSARIEHLGAQGRDAFGEYQLPLAALALKQGFGRLIRSASDRGIVAVLDSRLVRKSYGRAFLRTLPECSVFGTRTELREWWERTSPAREEAS